MNYDVVIVGAGHAGVQLAVLLAKSSFDGSVALLNGERWAPYERPPLSKGYLNGEESAERIRFRDDEYWANSPVTILNEAVVVDVDTADSTVGLATGERIGYGHLVWASGGKARQLLIPGHDLEGVQSVRTKDDADSVKTALPSAKRAVIIGGGFIGLESAAAFRKKGIEVTLLEVQDRLLARVTSPVVSEFFYKLHASAGVDIRLETGVKQINGADGRVESVELTTGEVIPADLVIVGVGLEPLTGPLSEAGIVCGNGVEVDQYCLTSNPKIFAIGDCASHLNAFAGGRRVRLESVQNANEQAKVVAAYLAGTPSPYHVVPTFWSNQFSTKLKVAGMLTDYDFAVIRGDAENGPFSVVYLSDERIVAIDCIDRIADFTHGKALIESGRVVDPDIVADSSRPLKDVAIAAV